MADDPNPALRAELEAALAVLEPEIRGLHNLATHSTASVDLQAAYREEITDAERRRDLINAALTQLDELQHALDDLESDGYPDRPKKELPNSLFQELQEEVSDDRAGAGVFTGPQPATQLKVSLGEPADKPTGV